MLGLSTDASLALWGSLRVYSKVLLGLAPRSARARVLEVVDFVSATSG